MIIINDSDNVFRQVFVQLTSLNIKLLVIEFDEKKKTTNQAYQHLLEQ